MPEPLSNATRGPRGSASMQCSFPTLHYVPAGWQLPALVAPLP